MANEDLIENITKLAEYHPTEWEDIIPVYDSGTTYSTGDKVSYSPQGSDTAGVYESKTDDNTGNLPTDTNYWDFLGYNPQRGTPITADELNNIESELGDIVDKTNEVIDAYNETAEDVNTNTQNISTLDYNLQHHTHTEFNNDVDINGILDILGVGGSSRVIITQYGLTLISADSTTFLDYQLKIRSQSGSAILRETFLEIQDNRNGTTVTLDADGLEIKNSNVTKTAVLQDEYWTVLPLENGITAYNNGGYNPPGFRKIGDVVEIVGSVSASWDGSHSTVVAQLPAGYRPSNTVYALVPTQSDCIARIFVNNSGEMKIEYIRWLTTTGGHSAGDPVSGTRWVQIKMSYPVI